MQHSPGPIRRVGVKMGEDAAKIPDLGPTEMYRLRDSASGWVSRRAVTDNDEGSCSVRCLLMDSGGL